MKRPAPFVALLFFTMAALSACASTPPVDISTHAIRGVGPDGPPVSLYVLPVARISAPRFMTYKGGGFGTSDLAVLCFLVRHPTAGDILIDLGYPSVTAENPEAYPGFPIHTMMHIRMDPGAHVAGKLQALGLHAGDIDLILFTHLHNDHIGDIHSFPEARLLVHAREWEAAAEQGRRHGYRPDYLAAVRPDRFTFPESAPYGPFATSLDILGDGTLVAVPTPGHTLGHVSYFVHTPGQSFFLTGDAAWVAENYAIPVRKGWLPHRIIEADRGAQADTLARIHRLFVSRKDILLIPGHDGRVLRDRRVRSLVMP